MNKPLILVVEDDTPVRNLITMTLKTHEYRYLSAQNGASAVMEALSHNPDIVLLDLGLPDMDGVEVIQKIPLPPPARSDPGSGQTGSVPLLPVPGPRLEPGTAHTVLQQPFPLAGFGSALLPS